MDKQQISASVETETVNHIQSLAEKEGRSFSWMVNHLLTQLALKDKLKKKV